MNNKELAKELVEKISTPIYDALCKLYKVSNADDFETKERQQIVLDEIENCLNYLGVDSEDFKQYKKEANDFWNDKNKKGNYWCDIRDEYADNQTSIYNYQRWENASILQDWIKEAIDDFGSDMIKSGGLEALFGYGECIFYEAFASEILEALQDYINNNA